MAKHFVVTTPMEVELVERLDEVKVAIRRKCGRTVPRSVLMRSMILAVLNSGLDLSDCSSAKKLEARIRSLLVSR